MNNGKSKILAILLFAISLISMSLFGISCKKPQESADNGVAKEATYYCATEENNFVTLTKAKTYVLSIAGEQKTGDYALSESGELKLTVDSGEVTATIKSDELAITYGGKSYTLIEQIDRSVTFNDDGATTTATVLNGKSVAKPADPEEKEGKKFVGWYTSEEYKEVYNFATPVRSDITVYAQHVKLTAGAKEFTVTLKDGSNEKLQTTNGIVYGLEQLAAKDGAEFDGWYVSDFNDEAKLTYKYNGEVLKENVNLYPVWKGEISGVSVTESKISWEADGTSFDVKITDADNVSETKRATQKYLDYDFKNVGEYKIEIGKTGSDKTTTVYYNSKVLARVSNITVVEGGIVSYNTVENAEKYIVTVECGNENHKHTDVDNGKRAYFDISGCDMKEGGIKVIIVAQAKDYGSSQSEAFYYDRTLDKIAAVEVKDGKLVWSEVKNALGYVVVVNGEKIELDNVTEYSLKGYAAGDYALEVYPVTKGYNSPAAATTTYKKEKLATPAGVAVNGNFLKWESVAGATSYTVKLNGKTFTSDKNEAELNAEDIKTDNTVTITAIGDGVQSEESDEFVFAQGKMSELAYEDGKVEWQGIFGAKAYIIKLNGNPLATVAGDITSYKVAYKIAGENKITVGYTVDEESTTAISETSITVKVYTVSFVAADGENLGTEFAAVGDTIDAPAVEKAGYVFSGWYKVPDGNANNAKKFDGDKLETAGDLTFYADFNTAKYSVILNADGAESEQIEDIVSFKENFKLKTIEPEDDTLAFGGWYTEPGGMGKQITDHLGNGIGKWVYAYNGLRLYAKWYNLYNFTYKDQGFIVTGAEGLQYVTEVKIPKTHFDGTRTANVVTIDQLDYGENLVSIDIPDTVTTIQMGAKLGITSSAFSSCKSLKSINIYETGEATNSGYVSYDGVLYVATYVNNTQGEEVLNTLNLVLVPKAKDGAVEVKDGTTSIDTYAFATSAVENVTIPETVTEVGDYAFSSMTKLTEVTFLGSDANKQVTLGEGVFASNSKLEKVTFPAGLKASTHHVVEYKNGSEDISTVEGLKTVIYEYDIDFDTYLFNKSTKVKTIEVNGNGGYYKSIDGMLCKADGTIVYCPKGRDKAVVTTNEITAIGDGAFRDCNNIQSVTIGGSVTRIGFEAFFCSYSGGNMINKLDTLIFDTDANDSELVIDERAFYYTKLTELTLPENLVELGKYAFGNTTMLKTITVESLGVNGKLNFADDAFAQRPASNYHPEYYAEKVVIGKNVPAFSISAVFGSQLVSVTIDPANDNFKVDGNIYYDKTEKQILFALVNNITGELVIKDGVEVIGANAFADATKITAVTIPATVKVIGDGAFRCYNTTDIKSKLTSLVFATGENAASTLEIGDQAFFNCAISGALVLPERLTKIGDGAFTSISASSITFSGTKLKTIGSSAFEGCDSLTTIRFSEGVESIGNQALNDCKSLETVYLPSTITEIGDNLFYNCEKLQTISVTEPEGTISKFSSKDGVLYKNDANGKPSELLVCPIANAGTDGVVTVPDTVILVKASAFNDNLGVKQVIFEDYTDEFLAAGNQLFFEDATNSVYGAFYGSAIEYIKFPKGLVTVPSYVINKASKLKKIFIPNTVSLIEPYSVSDNSVLETIEFEEGNDDLPLEIADGTSGYNSAFGLLPALKGIVFPARTTKIGAYALYLQSKNTKDAFVSVTIPAGVSEIGDFAFGNRGNLATVTIEDTEENPSRITKIGSSVFYNATKLTAIKLPSGLEEIGTSAFASSGINEITIPSKVVSIGNNAFEKCTSLTSLKFEQSEKGLTIGKAVFNGCTKLATIELPEGLTEIGETAFVSVAANSITIPSTVTTIGVQAFKDSSLGGNNGSVTFALDGNDKSSLKSVGKEAFGGTKLTSFEFPETAGTISLGDNIFQSCMSLTSITLSTSVKELGNALGGASEITEIGLPEGGSIKNENGFITNGKDSIYAILGALKLENGVLTIKEGITTIGERCFEGFTDIKKVVLPSTIMSIGARAFANCTSLENVVFTDGAPSLFEISGRTFENCLSLKSISLPDNLETISYYAFANSGLESIKIPATVTTLGGIEINKYGNSVSNGNSFDSCKSLKTVTFAKSGELKILTKETFKNCTALETVTLPEGLEEIGSSAFANTKLSSFEVGVVVTTIGSSAFSGVTSLEEVKFADNGSLLTIDSSAFYGSGLRSVKIPSTVTTLGSSAFRGCENLVNVTFDGGFIATIGSYTFANTAIESITIPNSVTVIKSYAFQGCAALTEVNLSSRLTALGTLNNKPTSSADTGYVFDGCTALESITLPDTLTYIGTYTFNNTALKSITIPEKVVNLTVSNADLSAHATKFQYGSSSAGGTLTETNLAAQFANCPELTEVILPITLKSIGAGVFYNTPKLTTIKYDGGEDNVLPDSVIAIGGYAFANSGLKTLKANGIKEAYSNAFRMSAFTSVDLSASPLEIIRKSSFLDTTELTTVSFPDALTSIEDSAFEGSGVQALISVDNLTTIGKASFKNSGLKTINLSKVSSVGDSAFEGCKDLTQVSLNNSLSSLSASMFKNCSSLTSLTIPDGVVSINTDCLYGSGITNLTLSANVASLSLGALASANLTSVTIADNNSTYKVENGFIKTKANKLVAYFGTDEEVTLPENTSELSAGVFAGNAKVKKIIVPGTVTTLTENMFYKAAAEEIVLNEGVTTIEKNAFNGCENLKKLVLPSTITTIKSYAFSYAGKASAESQLEIDLSRVPEKALQTERMFENSYVGYVVLPDHMTQTPRMFFGSAIYLKSVNLPEGITTLRYQLFYGCKTLQEVKIPSTVTKIDSTGIFSGCYNLTSVTFLGDELTEIPASTFNMCCSLRDIQLPAKLQTIGNSAFSGTTTYPGAVFTEITIPATVTSIGGSAFKYCYNLKKVIFEGNNVDIGANAFQDCTSLEEIDLTKANSVGAVAFSNTALKSITLKGDITYGKQSFQNNAKLTDVTFTSGAATLGDSMFTGCTELTKVVLPNATKTIPASIFSGCAKLEEVVIPDTVTSIGSNAFYGCSSLKAVNIGDKVTSIGTYAFQGCTSIKSIYIPESVIELGKTTSGTYAVFTDWTSEQTINFAMPGYKAFKLYGSDWVSGCSAKVNFGVSK